MSDIKRLDTKQSRRINTLVRKECCNFDGGHCILLDDGDPCVCPQIISFSLLCRWCRVAVLPLDKELYIQLTRPPNTKQCSVCGRYYLYKGNKSKYCPDCKKTVLRRQKADYQRRQRYKVE